MMEAVLKILERYSSIYPDYPGTIERDGMGEIVRLRYFAKPCEMMIEEQRLDWNRAVRDLDVIAPRILAILEGQGQTIEQAETHGASVMFHFLKDDWKPNRGSINSITNAFRMISNQLEILSKTPPKGKPDRHDVTKWVRKNWHKYGYNKAETVRKYIEIHAGTFDQLYKIDLKNDLKQNPLSNPKKSD